MKAIIPPQLPEQIETTRLIIRSAKPGDGALLSAAVHESQAKLAPWLDWVTPPPDAEQAERNCRRFYAQFLCNEGLVALLFLKSNGALVGGSGLHHPNWQAGNVEVGYWGHIAYGGQGFITEAARALSDYALQQLGMNRVFLTTDDNNRASWRVAERAGFLLEGIMRNERLTPAGNLRDTRIYARVQQRTAQPPSA